MFIPKEMDAAQRAALQVAKDMQEHAKKMAQENPGDGVKKSTLLAVAPVIWESSYKHYKEDEAAFNGLVRSLRQAFAAGFDKAGLILASLQIPAEQIYLVGSALWYDQGLSSIVMGHKYAASLLSTKLSKDVLAHVRPPWRAFHIEVPNGLIQVDNELLGTPTDIRGILTYQLQTSEGPKWSYVAYTDTTTTLHRHGYTTEQLVDADCLASTDNPFNEPFTDLDMRATLLVSRLIVNVCLAMSDPSNVTPPKERKATAKGDKRRSPEPVVRTYMLGKDKVLGHDCRQAVKDYLAGRTASPIDVQVLVAGHWKNQPHGPQLSLRKLIWVEPYWRGPEDSPIAVNARVLK